MEDALFEFKVSRTYQGAIEGRGIKNPADLMAFFYERVYRKIDAWQRENCVAVYLDAGNHILGWELLSIGTSCKCLVDVKGIIRSACLTGAASVALAHNHPSVGDCRPSKADIEEASRIQTILKSAGIILLDFVILTQDGGGYTFSEDRVIKCEISPENGQETQQPKGWSEDDERMRNNTILSLQSLLDEAINDDFIKGVKNEISWLKSLRPQTHWKPSEEQMEALEHFVRSWGESGTMSPQNPTLCAAESLLNDLKKL